MLCFHQKVPCVLLAILMFLQHMASLVPFLLARYFLKKGSRVFHQCLSYACVIYYQLIVQSS